MDRLADPQRFFALDPAVTFLNHGSFGACPRPVLAVQAELRSQLEAEPVRFFVRELPALLEAAREALAAFVGAPPEELAFVPNATTGVNAVVRSLDFGPGDEILTTDHAYRACRNALDHVAARTGARVVAVKVPWPVTSADEVVAAVLAGAGPRTRLALLDHVTSATALVLPIAALVRALEDRGIPVLVDGAHAPGMVPLDLRALGASWYTGNCHKWLCAPKGAAFLHARRDRQAGLHPVTTSHGYSTRAPGQSPFHAEFDWTGTADPSPWLCVPVALAEVGRLHPEGWPGLMSRNHALALRIRDRLRAAAGTAPTSPDGMVGAMAAVTLPPGPGLAAGASDRDALQEILFHGHGIEVPVIPWPAPPGRLVRVSAAPYVAEGDVDRLVAVVGALPR